MLKLTVPAQGPYEVQLSMGRFPFDFVLYDYTPVAGGGWTRRTLSSGSDVRWVALPQDYSTDASLRGHRLVWSLAIVDLDDRSATTSFVAGLRTVNVAATLSESSDDGLIDPNKPFVMFAVDVQ